MKILLLGSGGREHALAWKISQSPKCMELFIAPGNAGTSICGTNVNLDPEDFDAIKKFVLEFEINLVIVGPEAPLVKGIYDFFISDPLISSIPVIGPSKNAAQLEGSKEFAKEFMVKHKIPTARFRSFDKNNIDDGIAFLNTLKPPFVLKADGLAGGKGVIIADDIETAKTEFSQMIRDQKFGKASAKVVIEEFLDGIELSVFILTDGTHYKILPTSKDYKRIGEKDTGLNTGGMGAVSPVPFANDILLKKVEEKIIIPTIKGLQKDHLVYKGFIYFGLMIVKGEPFVIEYNCRMGDPETEAVIPRIKSDLVKLFVATADESLENESIEIDKRYAATVVLTSGGYPESYEKGKIIENLDNIQDSIVFHAGTTFKNNTVVTTGGRVFAITSFGKDIFEAISKSNNAAEIISFDKKYYRKDIGFDLKKFVAGANILP